MNATENCSENISREHYISRNVLEKLGAITVSGMPWQPLGETKQISHESLTAKVLCERHNHALSPLDFHAGKAIDALDAAHDYVTRTSYSKKPISLLISGQALELWGLKVAAGTHFSKIASVTGEAAVRTYPFDPHKLALALTTGQVPHPAGMFIQAAEGRTGPHPTITVAPLVVAPENISAGCQLSYRSVALAFVVDLYGQSPDSIGGEGRYRPAVVRLSGRHPSPYAQRQADIHLTWPGGPIGHQLVEILIEPLP